MDNNISFGCDDPIPLVKDPRVILYSSFPSFPNAPDHTLLKHNFRTPDTFPRVVTTRVAN